MAIKSTGTAIFLPLFKGTFIEMLPVAKAMQAHGKWRPLFSLDQKLQSLTPLLGGIEVVGPDGRKIGPANHTSEPHQRTTLKHRIFAHLPDFFTCLYNMRKACRRACALFARHQDIRLLIVAGDRSIGLETATIAETNRHGIPSLIVPFALNYPEAAAEPRLRSGPQGGRYGVHTVLHRILRQLFPRWVWVYKGIPLFFEPPSLLFWAWLYRTMPHNPWITGGGSATQMAVESEAERAQLLEDGMDAAKMIVTGKPSLDAIAQQLASVDRNVTRRILGIGPGEHLLLCSVPQHAEHGLLTPERHREEMTFLFQTLAQSGTYVLLSLHPRSDRSWYQPLAESAGLRIADERIYQLLPACDVFTSCYSSIVAQAIALHKPTVVFDFYDLGYPPFNHAPGVTVIRDREQFLPALKHLLTDRDHYDTCVRAQEREGHAWAILDGKNTERVLAVAEELIGNASLKR